MEPAKRPQERVLVTGAGGFLGKHLVERLRRDIRVGAVYATRRPGKLAHGWTNEGCYVADLMLDLTDEQSIRKNLAQAKPTIIYHLAGVSTVRTDPTNTMQHTWVNTVGTHRLLDLMDSSLKTARFINFSSVTVTGDSSDESSELDAPNPTSSYAASKVATEASVNAMTAQGAMSGLNLRLAGNCGGHSTHGLVHDIVRKLLSPSEHLELIGESPGTVKPMAWAGDTAAFATLVGLGEETGTLNCAWTEPISVLRVAETVMESLEIEKPIRWLGRDAVWLGDNPVLRVDSKKFYQTCERMGWFPKYATSGEAVRHGSAECALLL